MNVEAAVAANAAWCEQVCRAYGVHTERRDGLAVTRGAPPAHYPDLATLEPGVGVKVVLAALADRGSCSVKDSYADLDLAPAGFVELLSAQWIGRSGARGTVTTCAWSVVTDAVAAADWEEAADQPGLLVPALLADPAVRALLARDGARVVGGTTANEAGGCVGLTNVFACAPGDLRIWSDVAAAAAASFPGLPLVGYEHGADLAAATRAGFAPLGPLRVWLRP